MAAPSEKVDFLTKLDAKQKAENLWQGHGLLQPFKFYGGHRMLLSSYWSFALFTALLLGEAWKMNARGFEKKGLVACGPTSSWTCMGSVVFLAPITLSRKGTLATVKTRAAIIFMARGHGGTEPLWPGFHFRDPPPGYRAILIK